MASIQSLPLKVSLFWSIILALVLSSCQSNLEDRTIPTAEIFHLYYPPSLGYMRENIASCISSISTIAPYLQEQSMLSSKLNSGDVLLTLGDPDWSETDYFATQIGDESIVFIVNGLNQEEPSEKIELMEIFSGRRTHWLSGSNTNTEITVWVYPDNSDLMNWLKNIFSQRGKLTPMSKIAPNPGAVLEAVSTETGSIGFLPESWLEVSDPQMTEKIKKLRLVDVEQEEMSLPILAYLSNKPYGGIRDFLFCLQER
jgi:hypothetical protein